jgi:phosphohistidine phosphatase
MHEIVPPVKNWRRLRMRQKPQGSKEAGAVRIYLMRHGDASSGVSDSIRPLSEQGVLEAEAAGRYLRKTGEMPDLIMHSTLFRSRRTAELARTAAGLDVPLRESENLAPEDSTEKFISEMVSEFVKTDKKILVVGHNPFISDLASLLLTRSKSALPIKFTTGSIFGADSISVGKLWTLRFYVPSKQMKALA